MAPAAAAASAPPAAIRNPQYAPAAGSLRSRGHVQKERLRQTEALPYVILREIHRQVSLRSLTAFSASRFGCVGDFRPGNGIVAQALLSVSRRSASLHRPQGALGSGPPKPLAWDRSLPPAVRETGRRSVGNRKECRLRHDYASFPGPQTPSSLRAYGPLLSEEHLRQRSRSAPC